MTSVLGDIENQKKIDTVRREVIELCGPSQGHNWGESHLWPRQGLARGVQAALQAGAGRPQAQWPAR